MLPFTVDRRKNVNIRGVRGGGPATPSRNKHIAKNVVSKHEKQFMVPCPNRCTQRRTASYALNKEPRTFDTRTNECRRCGFKKLPPGVKLGPGFKKASEL